VHELKEKIFKKKSIPVLQQTLSMKGQVLNDLLRIEDQGVRHRSALVLEPPDVDDETVSSDMPVKAKMSFRFLNTAPAINPMLGSSLSLQIKLWDGEMFMIDAEAGEYIDDIKDKIYDAKKIPLEYQLLQCQGKPVSENSTLEEQGIRNEATLLLALVGVQVEIPTGEIATVELAYTDTILKAKNLLKKTTGIPVDNQYLMMGGQELSDSKKLSDYGIVHEDVLTLETFKVKVADWDGELFDVNGLCHGNSVHELKAKISEIKGIPGKEQILKLGGKTLNDCLGLKDQAVKHRSVLVLEPLEEKSNSPTKEKMSFSFLNSALPTKNEKAVVRSSTLCLHIKHWTGETFPIKAEPTEYVDDVKEKIRLKKKIPVDKQRLKFQGKLVADDVCLQDQGIADNATLVLGLMDITVELPGGKTVIIEVSSEDTIVRMKRFLKKKTGVAVEQQFLMVGGELMENTKKLSLYKIEHGDTVKMETFRVSVVDWTGKMFEVDGIEASCNLSDLKSRIEQLKSIPSNQQILKVNGLKLNGLLRLKDQGVKHRSVLVLEPPDASFQSPVSQKSGLNSIRESFGESEDLSDDSTASPSSSLASPSPVKKEKPKAKSKSLQRKTTRKK